MGALPERKKSRRHTRVHDEEEVYKIKVQKELQLLQTAETEEERRARALARRRAIMEKYNQKPQKSVSEPTTAPAPTETSPIKEEDIVKGTNTQKETAPVFDMFSSSNGAIPVKEEIILRGANLKSDYEGYYCVRVGDILDNRFRVMSKCGKGVFSTVIRVEETETKEIFAIKLLRMNDMMTRTGRKESGFLEKIHQTTDSKKNACVRFYEKFEDRDYLCLVFEPMAFDLRSLLKKFGRGKGFNIQAVQIYAQKLFIALYHIRKCGIIHADVKPDNILVDETKKKCKLADFGSACDVATAEVAPYLQSRWYRSPEIILGLPYDCQIDVWSLGTCLYELFTGRVMFKGKSPNDMIRMFQEVRGPFPKRMLKQGAFSQRYFDDKFHFLLKSQDKKNVSFTKVVDSVPISRDIRAELLAAAGHGAPKDLVLNLYDLIDKSTLPDAKRRITPADALSHPFFTS
eukprot:TRINITY_DN4669_c0_g1_i2.p1 TRINITY_DN4669_c0_g1~~TRINITY_DN4669_c0_g1_i2.p1  ORF type:complete len:459 (-),score=83.96 TRINITY_DN4669_c0_g1_i2:105-1481(-)